MKQEYTHRRKLSGFRVEVAFDRRICSECKEIITRGNNCLVGFLIDCQHRTNGGKSFSRPIKLQMCQKCAESKPEKYTEDYPLENRNLWHKKNLEECRKKLTEPSHFPLPKRGKYVNN